MARWDDALATYCGLILLVSALGAVAHLDRSAPFSLIRRPAPMIEPSVPLVQTADDTAPTATPPAAPVKPPAPPVAEPPSPEFRAQYEEPRVKTVMELQQFRRVERIDGIGNGGQKVQAALINFNPTINSWFLLTVDQGPGTRRSYHLENSDPRGQQIHLDDANPSGLVITAAGRSTPCNLWTGTPTELEQAAKRGMPFAAICNGRLAVRNRIAGYRTNLEAVTDFLRDNVWQGEEIVGFVRDTFFQDAYRETDQATIAQSTQSAAAIPQALVGPAYADKAVTPNSLGIATLGVEGNRFTLGKWYAARNVPGTFLSVMEAQAVSPEVTARNKARLNPLDGVEAPALDYLIAFDLAQFDIEYAVGTDHPRLGWSPRAQYAPRYNPAGPDGVAGTAPLVTTGMVNPIHIPRVAASFTGGFKRDHGAFKWGNLANTNSGSHYGFVENGVVLSKLHPGLATLFTLDDGSIHMRTWTAADDAMLSRVRTARQNGVALVETAPDGTPIAGEFVNKWGPGNWSGSADANIRTIRAGACLRQVGDKQFLIYGYFSTATPSAMAAVFLSYGCSYAMLLDMNAIEHTYLAVYAHKGKQIGVEHLIRQMANIDQASGGKLVPRFIGFPDNRDFFYLVRRREGP